MMLCGSRRRRHAEGHEQDRGDQEEFGKRFAHRGNIRRAPPRHNAQLLYLGHIAPMRVAIQRAMAIIIKFSVSEMKPRGTLLEPPTQAHFNSRLSM